MCCHAAIEEVIAGHYNDQLLELHSHHDDTTPDADVTALQDVVRRLRDDEQHHHELGMAHGAARAPIYRVMYASVQVACSVGIWLAKRI